MRAMSQSRTRRRIDTEGYAYITQSFESSIPISIVIENIGDRPATILQYYTQLSVSFIRNETNLKPLFKEF